ELFRCAGGFDDAFESYLEDVDFGLRCAALGLKGRYVPEAVAYHQGSASLGRWNPQTVRRIARNQVYLVAKHIPLGRYWWAIVVGIAGVAAWRRMGFRHRKGGWVVGQALRLLSRAGDPLALHPCRFRARDRRRPASHRVRLVLESVLSTHFRWGGLTRWAA